MGRQVWQALFTYLLLSFITLTAIFSSPVTYGQQVSFLQTHHAESAETQFDYQWLDPNGQLRTLTYSLPDDHSEDIFTRLKLFSAARMNRSLLRPLTHFAQQQGWYQMEVRLSPFQKSIMYYPHIANASLGMERIAKMRAEEQRQRQAILNDSFLTSLTIPPNQVGLAPDHSRIATASMAHVEPVSRAFYNRLSGSSARDYVRVIASFIQAIPYNELTNRLDSNGQGFLPPAQLLQANKGDCDSKATLMAAILKNLMPNMTMVMIYMPNHALLAIAVNALEDDITIEYNGMTLVVVEPTGPSQLNIGKLSSNSALHVLSGNITIKPI